MPFSEYPLSTPTVTTVTRAVARPCVLQVDAETEHVDIESKIGEGTGAAFVAHDEHKVTLAGTSWNAFANGTQIAAWARAQGAAVTNAVLIERFMAFILEQTGVIS